ncbi:MAG TPA: hypothetical protein VFE31_00510 [Opitutaceae bacterium]|jgi:hypothetical protein|nr:hypothetical protein [Opitutaceae bacterium]
MAAVDETIVREYFEQNGFFVRQVRKYQVQSRKKRGEEEIDLLVYNPAWQKGSRAPDFFLFASELPLVQRALVAVKPWHTDVFTPATLRSAPDKIFSFLEENVLTQVKRLFSPDPAEAGGANVTKVLVLPALPTAEPYRSQSVELLKARGVDAIISFRAMLLDLIEKVETNRSYKKSDALQLIRILKNYDLLRDPQLDLHADLHSSPRHR